MRVETDLITATLQPPNATGQRAAEGSFVMNKKSEPKQYAFMVASELASVSGWQTAQLNPLAEKLV
jgi:hypothetical protein